jgi:hypothetical protein
MAVGSAVNKPSLSGEARSSGRDLLFSYRVRRKDLTLGH